MGEREPHLNGTTSDERRFLRVEGCYNLRDVGGYATRDGRRTRWRTLLRSDSLHRLTPAARAALLGHGVRTIVDLRRPREVERLPNVFAGSSEVRYHNLPILDDATFERIEPQAATLDDLYRMMLDHCGPQFGAAIAAIAGQDAAPALVHCAVGKDRTGVIVALALSVAGVPDDTIADDYAHSSALLRPLFDSFMAQERLSGTERERAARMQESRRETMLDTLAYLRARYGGAEEYLAANGFSEAGRLRATLLDEPNTGQA